MRIDLLTTPTTWDVLSRTGADYFDALVEHLCNLTGVAVAFVVEVMDSKGERVCPLASWGVEDFRLGRCYDTRDTPCERLRRGGAGIFPDRLAERFPKDRWLISTGMQSYVGLPLADRGGKLLGHIGLLDDQPMADPQTLAATLEAFVPRSLAELKRARQDRELERLSARQTLVLYRASPPDFATDMSLPRGSGFLGFSAEELTDRRDLRWRQTHQEDRERVLAVYRDSLESGDDFIIQYRLLNKDGSRLRRFLDYGHVERDRKGRSTLISGALLDITQDRQTGIVRDRETERQLLSRLGDLPGVVFRSRRDDDWVLEFIGGSTRALTGFAPEEFQNQRHIDLSLLIDEEDRPRVLDERSRAARENRGYQLSYRIWDSVLKQRIVLETGQGRRGARESDDSVEGFILDHTEQEQALGALRASEERFRSITATARDAIVMLDDSGHIRFWNPAATRIFGYTEDEALGRDAHEILAPARYRQEAGEGMQDFAQTAQGRVLDQTIRWEALRKDGTEFQMELSVSALKLNGRNHVVGIVRDVSDREQALNAAREMEKALRTTQAHLEFAVQTVPAVLFLCEAAPGLPISFVGSSLRELLGVQPEQVIGRSGLWTEFAYPEDIPALLEGAPGLLKNGDYEAEFRIQRQAPSPLWIQCTMRLVRDAAGNPLEVAGYLLDITNRKKAEQELRERATRLNHAQAIANLGSWETNLDSGEESWSDEVFRILGYAPRTFVPSQEQLLERIHRADQARVRERLGKALDAEAGFDMEFRVVRPNEQQRFVRCRGEILRAPDGRSEKVIGTLLDFTERKQAEIALERSRHALRELARYLQSVRENERTGIAREIHDELGQALTAMKIDIVRLRSRLPHDNAQASGLLESLLSSVDGTISTVQRVMSELRPFALDDLGLVAAIEWQVQQLQERSGLRCAVELPENEPELTRDAATALFRILQEALTNIVRHANARSVSVGLSYGDGRLSLRISDDGVGISPLDLENSRSFGIMGMRERAHVFGGQVDIEVQESGGTCVHASLPLSL